MKKSIVKSTIYLLLLAVFSTSLFAARIETKDTVKLTNGETLKSIYFFSHWWDPWKSDDAAITADLQKMKSIGINTVFLDHEVSQALDMDWYWLDREYKLVGQENMKILPWLQLHSVDRIGLMNFSRLQLKPAVNQDKVEEEGCISFRDNDSAEALSRYIIAYLDRYIDNPALLRISDGQNTKPVIGLVMEIGWRNTFGLPLSFDEDTNEYFRKWMKSTYRNITHLNTKWGTTYKSYDEIDPCDKTIFNYNITDENNVPEAVKEHMKFRSRIISDMFDSVAKKVRKRYKDVLFAVEVAYPFRQDSPEAVQYRWNNANDIRIINFADMVCIRTTGAVSTGQVKKDQDMLMHNGKRVLLSYRFFEDSAPDSAIAFALDGALSGNAIGYYSWNETADASSSIFNRPEQHAMLANMFSVYDYLNNPSKRFEIAMPSSLPPAAPLQTPPAPAPVDSLPALEPADAPVQTPEAAPIIPVETPAPPAEAPPAAPAPAETAPPAVPAAE